MEDMAYIAKEVLWHHKSQLPGRRNRLTPPWKRMTMGSRKTLYGY